MNKDKINLDNAFTVIMNHSHFWNWAPDWQIAKEIYNTFPNAYSILSPFAYSYLEELIRTRTSHYGFELLDKNGLPRKRKVGLKLINLAINENQKDKEFINLLEELKPYFSSSKISDEGNNRNSVVHGYMHPRYWTQESFENLINDICRLSQYGNF